MLLSSDTIGNKIDYPFRLIAEALICVRNSIFNSVFMAFFIMYPAL